MSFEKLAAWLLAIQHLNNQDKIKDNQKELIENQAGFIANQDKLNSNLTGIADEIRKQLDDLQESLVRKCAHCGNILKEGSSFCHVCGMKRHQCRCGEFLDAGMVFCTKCGKKKELSEEEKLYSERVRLLQLLETAKEQKELEAKEEKIQDELISDYENELKQKSQQEKKDVGCGCAILIVLVLIVAGIIWFLAH